MGGSAIGLEVPAEVGGTTIAPLEPSGASPSTQEWEEGSKRPCSDEVERGSGDSPPKRICRPTALRWVITSSIFSCFSQISS